MGQFYFASYVFSLFCCVRADLLTVVSGDRVEINCSDMQIIDIINITVTEQATECQREICTVNGEDKKEIQHQCNGKISCNITSNLQTRCLKKYGYFNLNFTCEEIVPFSCDFEQGMCNWKISQSDTSFQWTEGSSSNGPKTDHTTGSSAGIYMFTNASTGSDGDVTYFISEEIQPNRKQCLTFWYYITHNKAGSLTVYQKTDVATSDKIWTASRRTNRIWNYQIVRLSDYNHAYTIIFQAVRRMQGVIAIDDIVIANKDCYVSEHDCNFENDSCTWSTNETNKYHWKLHSGRTDTHFTGPNYDHTTGLGIGIGTYVYLEADGIGERTEADLSSSEIRQSHSSCLTFWYHMRSKDDREMGELKVLIKRDDNIETIWSMSGHHGNIWHPGFVNISITENFTLVFRGIRGNGTRGDIAIDDIYLLPQTCSVIKRSLSHLTKETHGERSYSLTCLNVEYNVEIQQCSKYYTHFNQSDLTFYPRYDECVNLYEKIKHHTEDPCNTTSSEFCALDFSSVLQTNSTCFMPNKLTVEFTCKDYPDLDALKSQESKDTAVTVGVIAVVIILACAVAVLIFVLRRSKHCKKEPKPPTKQQNNTVNLAAAGDYRSDYTGNQDIALPNASGHVIQLAMVKDGDQQYAEIGSIRNEEHTYTDIDKMTEEQTRPQYEYVDSEINGCIKRNKQDRSNVNCYPSSKDIESENNKSHYSFAKDVNLESNITEDYAVLDPNETGFNRSNVITDVEIDAYNKPDRSTNMENDLTTEMEDQYDVSNDGTYDASNNKHHKETENNVYSHTVDSVYDTSSHKRAKQENENAYDHFFEDRSADNNA